jgi:hypothetical protein
MLMQRLVIDLEVETLGIVVGFAFFRSRIEFFDLVSALGSGVELFGEIGGIAVRGALLKRVGG